MSKHLSLAELQAGLPVILDAPKDRGVLRAIVMRLAEGQRRDLETSLVSLEGGLDGDHWAQGCWRTTAEGKPDPDVQLCLMNARCIDLIAGGRENWPPAGDNLFIDMDLTPDNLPPGQRLAIGGAIIEITSVPHNGCDKFIQRFGRDACVFVNTGEGRKLRLRGIYARVVRDGRITAGDSVSKISGSSSA